MLYTTQNISSLKTSPSRIFDEVRNLNRGSHNFKTRLSITKVTQLQKKKQSQQAYRRSNFLHFGKQISWLNHKIWLTKMTCMWAWWSINWSLIQLKANSLIWVSWQTLWSDNLWAIYSYCQECLKHLNGQPVPQVLPKQERMGRRAFKM